MVDFQQLRDANVQPWRDAAAVWLALSNQMRQAAQDIREQGAARLTTAWRDTVGQAAYGVLSGIADEYESAADTMHGTQMVLDGGAA